MGRKRRILIDPRKRVNEAVEAEESLPKTVKAKPERWNGAIHAFTFTDNPKYHTMRMGLTPNQWQERGDLLRTLKRFEYVNCEKLSLQHLREAYRSTEHCSLMIAIHDLKQYRKGVAS